MGQFNDYRNVTRESWKFSYKGSELVKFAQSKYDFFTKRERQCRQEMAKMLQDENVRASDPKIEDLKSDIEKFGSEREKCIVWVHEFSRKPEETYSLSLGDVTYFDIAKLPA